MLQINSIILRTENDQNYLVFMQFQDFHNKKHQTQTMSSNSKGPSYTILDKKDNYELRQYDSCIVAETIVKGIPQDGVGHQAFNRLGGYIFGRNQKQAKINMTAPVTQFQISPGQYVVQFFMPKQWNLQTLPKPIDERIILKQLQPKKLFVRRYNGGWSQQQYHSELQILKKSIPDTNINKKHQKNPIWAKYDSPMALIAFRTNQIMLQAII